MLSHQGYTPLELPVTSAESIGTLLIANEEAFSRQLDEEASHLVYEDCPCRRNRALIARAAAETCARLREALVILPSR